MYVEGLAPSLEDSMAGTQFSVVQGYFRSGVPRPGIPPLQAPHMSHEGARRAPTYQELCQQAHKRSTGVPVQPATVGNRTAFALPLHLANFSRGPGQRLTPAIQQKMSSFFKADFSDVQIHVGPEATSIGALAFTLGSNIFFAPGQYNPDSHFGQQLLAHELAHVVQQRAGRIRNPFGSGLAVVHDPVLETEAERLAKQAPMHGAVLELRSPSSLSAPTQTGPSGLRALQKAPVVPAAPAPAPPPAPVLTAVAVAAQDQEGLCGNFQRVRQWNVANPVQGVIVQEVWRTFRVRTVIGGAALAGAALDAYVTDPRSSVHATETHYWELWQVTGAGVVSDGGNDTFGLCSLIPWNGPGPIRNRDIERTTKGSFVMRGLAQFYPTAAAPATFGFARNGVAAAGGLFSSLVAPVGLPAAVGATVDYRVTVKWNSGKRTKRYSTVT